MVRAASAVNQDIFVKSVEDLANRKVVLELSPPKSKRSTSMDMSMCSFTRRSKGYHVHKFRQYVHVDGHLCVRAELSGQWPCARFAASATAACIESNGTGLLGRVGKTA